VVTDRIGPSAGRAACVVPFLVAAPGFTQNPADARLVLIDVKFLLWCILFVLCWPLALLALILYPIVWILLIPFRIVGVAVDGVLGLLFALVSLPARLVSGPRRL
jgi:hypothetical protein